MARQRDHESARPRSSHVSPEVLEDLDLAGSVVHTVMACPSSLVVLLDARLDRASHDRRAASPDGSGSLRNAAVIFTGVSEIVWQHGATDSAGAAEADRIVVDGRRCRVALGADVVELVAKDVRLVVDGHDTVQQRPEAAPGRARLDAGARRHATSMVLDRLEPDPAARRFWRSVVEAALEAVDTRPPDPPLVGWPFVDDDSFTDRAFADVHLPESHLLTVVAMPGTVTFLLDAAIRTSSPYWREPPPGEWATWLPATLRFAGVTALRWFDAHQPPAFDADLEKDYGSIDSLTYRGSTYRIDTGAGVLQITATAIDLDVRPQGRPE